MNNSRSLKNNHAVYELVAVAELANQELLRLYEQGRLPYGKDASCAENVLDQLLAALRPFKDVEWEVE